MDTLINITLKVSYLNKEYSEINKTIKLNEYESIYIDKCLFEFKEYAQAEITFNSSNPTTTLIIESHYDGGTKSSFENTAYNYDEEDLLKTLKPGESLLLSPGGDSDDMLVPGEYSVKISVNNLCYEGFFYVIPQSANWDSIVNMRNYLESIVRGLSYNIYLDRKCSRAGKDATEQTIERYKYLEGIYEKFLSHIKYVVNNPISDIEKLYKLQSYSKNPDSKSQRWQNKKGIRYNLNALMPTNFYEKHTRLTYNTKENRMLKRMLEYIQNLIIEAENEYIKVLNSLSINKNALATKLEEEKKLYKKTLKMINTTRENRGIKKNIDILNKDIKDYESNEQTIKNYIEKLNKLKNRLNYYINETWIRDLDYKFISTDTSSKIFKNLHYNEIYNIYNKLRSSNTEGNTDITFPKKKTSKLFEIYIFLLTKNVFENLGFDWVDGWIKSEKYEDLFNGDLNQGEYIVLKKLDYKIIIRYDVYLNTPSEIVDNIQGDKDISDIIVSDKNSHRKPDILVSLYKDNEFLASEVIEVKYRRKAYIYNSKVNTNVCKQLISYTLFKPYDIKTKKVDSMRSAVYRVICIFPKQDDIGKFQHKNFPISFIPIMPSIDNNQRPYGYEYLKGEIIDFLSYFKVKAIDKVEAEALTN